MRSLIASLSTLALTLAPCEVSVAQWGLSTEIGVARFGGTGRDTSGIAVGPYRPTTFGLRVDREAGPVRVAVVALYAQTGIAGVKDNLAVVDYNAASLLEVAPEVSLRLARLGAGAVARLEGGPAVDVWEVDGETRTRVGARAALALECPLGGRFVGSVRATGVLSGSIIDPDETANGVERHATRRGGVSIGLRLRL
jgi:hypothetical protein